MIIDISTASIGRITLMAMTKFIVVVITFCNRIVTTNITIHVFYIREQFLLLLALHDRR